MIRVLESSDKSGRDGFLSKLDERSVVIDAKLLATVSSIIDENEVTKL